MKDFDIAKYLREHQLGSYGILNHYVDLKHLKEDQGQSDLQIEDEVTLADNVKDDSDNIKAFKYEIKRGTKFKVGHVHSNGDVELNFADDGSKSGWRESGFILPGSILKKVSVKNENQYVEGKHEISEMGVEDDYMYDPYADEYNSNAQPGTNPLYIAASKKADELEAQAKKDPKNRQLRLAADKAREEALEYAQMFRESVSEADSMTSDNGWQYDDDDFYGGDSGAGGLVNKLDLKKMAGAVVSIIEDLEADGYHPEEIQEFLIDKVREVCRPYMK